MKLQALNITKVNHEREIRGRVGSAHLLEGVTVQTEDEAIKVATDFFQSKGETVVDVDALNLWVSDYRGIRYIVGWEVFVETN